MAVRSPCAARPRTRTCTPGRPGRTRSGRRRCPRPRWTRTTDSGGGRGGASSRNASSSSCGGSSLHFPYILTLYVVCPHVFFGGGLLWLRKHTPISQINLLITHFPPCLRQSGRCLSSFFLHCEELRDHAVFFYVRTPSFLWLCNFFLL